VEIKRHHYQIGAFLDLSLHEPQEMAGKFAALGAFDQSPGSPNHKAPLLDADTATEALCLI
jgi:hypothetical protein